MSGPVAAGLPRGGLRAALKLAGRVAVLALVASRFPDRRTEVAAALRGISAAQIAAVLVGGVAGHALFAVRWRALLSEAGSAPPSLGTFFGYTLVSQFLALAAPGGVQMLVQGVITRGAASGGAEPWAALAAERLVTMATNLVVAGLAVALLPSSSRMAGAAVCGVGLAAVATLAVAHRFVDHVERWLPARAVVVARAVGPRVRRPAVLGPALAAHVVLGLLFAAVFLPGSSMRPGDVVGACLLASWATLLPSVFGLGPSQVVQVALLGRAGGDPSTLAAQSLAIWALGLFGVVAWGAIAWFVTPLGDGAQRPPSAA